MNLSTQYLVTDNTDKAMSEESLRLRLLRQLYDQAPSAIIAMPFCSILLVLGIKDAMNITLLLSWLTGILLLTLIRSIAVYLFSVAQNKEERFRTWHVTYIVIELLSGLLWASTALFLPQLDILHQMFVFFAFGGMLMGASVILAPIVSTYIAYSVPSGILFISGLSSVDSELYLPMAVLTTLFILVLVYITYLMNQRIVQALQLADENLQLIQEAKHTNQQLEMRISEKEQMETKLLSSRNELSRIIEHMQETYYRVDLHDRIQIISPSVRTLLGYQEDELSGTEITALFEFPKNMDEFIARLQGQNGKLRDFETRLITKDEHRIWVSINAQYSHDKKGTITGIEGTIRDVSQNRITSEAVLKAKEEYKNLYEFNYKILENSPVGILTLDENNKTTYMNPALKRIVGAPEDSSHIAEGRDLTSMKSVQQADMMDAFVSLMNGDPIHIESPFTSLYGKSAILEIHGIPLFDGGKYNGSLVFITDITKKAREKDILTSAHEQAEKDRRSKEIFIEKISEELKTPLTDIIGMTDILISADAHADIREDLGIIYDASRSIANYIETISELVAGHEDIRGAEAQSEISLRQFFDAIMIETRELFPDNTFNIDIPESLTRKVMINRSWFSRIFSNILSGLATNGGSGTINAKVSLENAAEILIRFSHSTFVIPENYINNSLRPREANYQHSDENINQAVTCHLVEALNGKIDVNTDKDGSAIILGLPVRLSTPEESKNDIKSDVEQQTNLKILAVEDNFASQTVIRKMLENLQHEVTVVPDGNSALDQLARENYDLVLMDINMPGMDGMQTTRAIRAFPPQQNGTIPIIAVTASSPLNREKWTSSGINSYILKPLSLNSLNSVINSTIQHAHPGDKSQDD